MSNKTRKITMLAMLAAIACVVMYVSNIFLPTIAGFLQYDVKDVIIAFGGFAYGPTAVAVLSVIVSFIEMIISGTGPWGFLMNVISTLAFSLPIVFIYRNKRTKGGAYLALAAGTVSVTCVMMLWNILVIPLYNPNADIQTVINMLPAVIFPFNFTKAVLNSALLLVLYKPLMSVLRRFCRMEAEKGSKAAPSIVTFVISALLVGGCIAAILLLHK